MPITIGVPYDFYHTTGHNHDGSANFEARSRIAPMRISEHESRHLPINAGSTMTVDTETTYHEAMEFGALGDEDGYYNRDSIWKDNYFTSHQSPNASRRPSFNRPDGSGGGPDDPKHPLLHESKLRKLESNTSFAGMTTSPFPLQRTINIPPGYAYAQLLPSRVIRLSIRLPRPFEWAAGQNVSVYIPAVAKLQSHPFSISTAYTKGKDREIVLIIKARKGFTAKLYEHIREKLYAAAGVSIDKKVGQPLSSLMKLGETSPPPVLLRAMLDGPFGSAARAKPSLHHTVVLICGGTGVSYGASCLEDLCNTMADLEHMGSSSRSASGLKNFKTRRVRFVWIVREFSRWNAQVHKAKLTFD